MIIVKLKGGLGNQMFQYATGKRLALTNNVPLKLDVRKLKNSGLPQKSFPREYALNIFDFHVEFATEKEIIDLTQFRFRNILSLLNGFSSNRLRVLREKQFHFDKTILNADGNCYLDGYWQSPKYFDDISAELKQDFKIRSEYLHEASEFEKQIKNTNAVCIHVRRGDLVSENYRLQDYCRMEYFQKAIFKVADQVEDPEFFIFSDDIKWCKVNFKLSFPFQIIQVEESKKLAVDFYLMTLCQHFIISNSTFSWWAVWLNRNKKNIVIAPENWFLNPAYNTKDLIPKNWIRI